MSAVLSKCTKSLVGVLGLVAVASALFAADAIGPTGATDEKAKLPGPPPVGTKPAAEDKQEKSKPNSFVVNVLVMKPDGKPAANANVSVWAEQKKHVEGKSNADGRVDLTVPTFFPKVTVVATGDGFAPNWAEVSPVLTKQVVGPRTEITLCEIGPALAGRVTDLEGRAVANLPVAVERIGQTKPGKALDDHIKTNPEHRRGYASLSDLDAISAEAAGLPKQVTTDKDGKFEITGVGKDRSVRIATRGETTEHLQVRVVTRALDAKLEQHGPFGLHGATFTLRVGPSRTIVGAVRDAKTGTGVPGMKIADLLGNICETATDKDGRFRLVGVRKDARYMIGSGSLGESPYFDTMLMLDDPQGLGEIVADIKVHRGAVATGRVTNSTGKPVTGTMVYNWTADNPHVKEYSGITDSRFKIGHWGQLDSDGRYKLLVIPGGGAIGVCGRPEDAFPRLDTVKELDSRGVRAYPTAALHAVVAVTIDPKVPKTLRHDFTLATSKARDLVIRGVDGKLPDKLLAVGQSGAMEAQKVVGDTLKLTGLSPTRARAVVLVDEAKTVGAVAAVRGDGDTPATVTLVKLGTVAGRVYDADGNPAAGAEVRMWLLLDREKYDNLPDEVFILVGFGSLAPGAWQQFTSRTTKTDKGGRFELPGLLPGQEYRLVTGFNLEKRGGELLHQRAGVSVKAGEQTDLGDLKPKK